MRLPLLAAVLCALAAPAAAQLMPYAPPAPFAPGTAAAAVFPQAAPRLAPPAAGGAPAQVIMGEPNFVRIADLPADDPDVALSAKVGQLWFNFEDKKWSPICSGALVGPNLFLTAFVCAVDGESGVAIPPSRLAVVMDHVSDGKFGAEGMVANGAIVLKADYRLNYALLALDRPIGEKLGWLALETDPAAVEAAKAVKIIQHPQGRPKEIARDAGDVAGRDGAWLRYLADTESGSVGAPVFARDGATMIAMHQSGYADSHNEGLMAPFLAAELALYLPQSAAKAAQSTQSAPAAPAAAKPDPANPLLRGAAGARPLFGN